MVVLAFEIEGRQMRANVLILASKPVMHENQHRYHYRAKFIGLTNADVGLSIALTGGLDAPAEPAARRKSSSMSLQSHDLLPLATQEQALRAWCD